MDKKIIFPVYLGIFCLLALVAVFPGLAYGSEAIKLAVSPGINGIYKFTGPVQLHITAVNNGPATNGQVVVALPRDERNQRPDLPYSYCQSIMLPAGKTATADIFVPGAMIAGGAQVKLTAGSYTGQADIEGTAVNGGVIVLNLTENTLADSLAVWLEKNMAGSTVKSLKPWQMPADPLALKEADMIIINQSAVDGLTSVQLDALKEWTALGGTLVLSQGAGTDQNGSLAAISPVLVQGRQYVSGTLPGLGERGNLLVAAGPLQQGKVLLGDSTAPLLAAASDGKGRVIFSGPDLKDLNSGAIWPVMFGQFSINKTDEFFDSNGFLQAATYLPQLHLTDVRWLALAWIAYMILVGPVIYLVLRRKGRREWSWWLIPAGALLMSGIVYLVSPAYRINQPVNQTLATADIVNNHLAEIHSVAAFVAPRTGDLDVRVADRTGVVWSANLNQTAGMNTSGAVIDGNGHKSLTFPKVGYWSMRQAVAYSMVNNLGQLSYRLSLTDGRITGEIKNNTGLNLRDCRLVLGGTAVNLGSLPVGSSKTVDSTLARQGPFPTLDSLVNQLLPAPVTPGQPDAYVRERQMLEQPVNRSNNLPGGLPVYFIGWSDHSTGTFKLTEAGAQARDYGLMLVRQPLALTFTPGQPVKLPPGLLCGDMNLTGNGQGESTSKGWLLGKGKSTLQFDLANLLENHNFQITQIQLPARRGSAGQVMRVFDWRANHWNEVPAAGLVIAGADLERYTDKHHMFKYQIERVSSAAANQQPLPDIGVEGVIEP